MQGAADVKSHPWFANFDWEALKERAIKPEYVPDLSRQNFDSRHVNNQEWHDTEDIIENK